VVGVNTPLSHEDEEIMCVLLMASRICEFRKLETGHSRKLRQYQFMEIATVRNGRIGGGHVHPVAGSEKFCCAPKIGLIMCMVFDVLDGRE